LYRAAGIAAYAAARGLRGPRARPIAADLGLQLDDVRQLVACAQLIAIIGGCVEVVETTLTRTPRRCNRLDQRAEIAVAREQHHVSMCGEFQASTRARYPSCLYLAAAGLVDKLFGRLVTTCSRCSRASRSAAGSRKFLILDNGGVIERPQQIAATELAKSACIDVKAERLRVA